MSTESSGFLLLPAEIRLEIYGYCTVLALLQLTSTAPALHNEINAYPSIIRASFGFRSLKSDVKDWTGLQIKHVGFFLDLEDQELWCRGRIKICAECGAGLAPCYSKEVGEYKIDMNFSCDECFKFFSEEMFDVGRLSTLHDPDSERCYCCQCMEDRYEHGDISDIDSDGHDSSSNYDSSDYNSDDYDEEHNEDYYEEEGDEPRDEMESDNIWTLLAMGGSG
ncbi:hypothetical protein BJ508DRAFT_328320 [Ascobolus immersus RN42]|uniref:F-box domain-containing protein n=1 Tax=Ascobolus immersus RN42 TaxID=1160509 RepID=A0A3N4I5H1_ASCIM|nr:hypothetical protein BJ508DRAFT_328320 [Ascobolus immersus RN42]